MCNQAHYVFTSPISPILSGEIEVPVLTGRKTKILMTTYNTVFSGFAFLFSSANLFLLTLLFHPNTLAFFQFTKDTIFPDSRIFAHAISSVWTSMPCFTSFPSDLRVVSQMSFPCLPSTGLYPCLCFRGPFPVPAEP